MQGPVQLLGNACTVRGQQKPGDMLWKRLSSTVREFDADKND